MTYLYGNKVFPFGDFQVTKVIRYLLNYSDSYQELSGRGKTFAVFRTFEKMIENSSVIPENTALLF